MEPGVTTRTRPPAELLDRGALIALGLRRADVERVFASCPTVTFPGGNKRYVHRRALDDFLARHTEGPVA